MLNKIIWYALPRWAHTVILKITGYRLVCISSTNDLDVRIPEMFVWSKRYPIYADGTKKTRA